jgi:hypothetical protein
MTDMAKEEIPPLPELSHVAALLTHALSDVRHETL